MGKVCALKKEYEMYSKELLKVGIPLVKDTKHGIWGVSDFEDIKKLFGKIELKNKIFIDLGSGDGRVVLLAGLHGAKAVGIEGDKELHDKAVEIRDRVGIKAELVHGDYLEHDISKYDIVFINPDKDFSRRIEDKLLDELKGVLYVYNHTFKPRFLVEKKRHWFEQIPVLVYTKSV